MGFFDFLRASDDPSDSQIQKAVRQVTQPHGDPAVRMGGADRLKAWGTPAAISGLLRRFTVQTPSGQLDQEESQQIEAMLVDLGEAAVEPIVKFLQTEANVGYSARALEQILPQGDFVTRILGVLEMLEAGFGSHNEQREGLIRTLDEIDDERIAPVFCRFLLDPTDDVALAAMRYVVRRGGVDYLANLVDLLAKSADRPRVREGVAEMLVESGWPMQTHRKQVDESLPAGFALDKRGRVVRL